MAPAVFDVALKDLQAYCGAATEPFLRFAELRRPKVRDQIPRCSFKITETRRVERAGEPDLLVASGTAPAIALRFRLNHAEGKARFLDEARWSAEFPVGPEGGEALLQALDFGGNEVARAMVDVKARPSALSIPAQEPEYVEEKIDQDGTRGPAPGATAEWEGEEVEKEPSSHPEAFPYGAERLLSKTSPQSAAALKTSAWGQSALLLSLFGVTLLGALWIWRRR